ncbi:RidA family protein [Lampropedia aestuarii]|uniref:RidA family protein n=1 Tax=Lampropedia aestuarii TaxID=2562762 RepID=A0A4S5BMG4_9BURK|nr:RidA family protein [Lampropedia aestuarii]MDH5858382.1 RidA family protein [Lampropedia aestuarii]THJ32021.1 RidA family protein [Lampropedia aestuarii]
MSSQAAIERRHVGARLSETAVFNGVVYLAGQIPENNPGADIRIQTQEVLGHIDRLLAEVGASKKSILQCQIYLSDISEIGAMNEVWDAWVAPGHTPPRATVQALLANADYRIEVVVVAAVEAA